MTYYVGSIFKAYTYNMVSKPVIIDHPLAWMGWGTFTGYVDIILPPYGTWVEGYPPNWPAPSATGSGLLKPTGSQIFRPVK